MTAEFLGRRLWRPLGFGRLSDYAAERLGIGARTLEEDARVATALETLPALRQAFENGAIRWTHARMLAGVATPETERGWLRLALSLTTRGLAELLKGVRPGDRAPEGAGPDACASRGAPASGGDAHTAHGAQAVRAANAAVEAEDPPVRWSIVTTRGGRRLWRAVGDLASRMHGAD
ncbi:MAG: hypothetical protein LC667_19505, partial [Thioalkalivibrio sp.]|nr:hypothetical protein [Thioalkalivibrio sp.]